MRARARAISLCQDEKLTLLSDRAAPGAWPDASFLPPGAGRIIQSRAFVFPIRDVDRARHWAAWDSWPPIWGERRPQLERLPLEPDDSGDATRMLLYHSRHEKLSKDEPHLC